MAESAIAKAIDRNFTSPNVADSNLEAANVVDVIHGLANGLYSLANAFKSEEDDDEDSPTVAARLGEIAKALNYLGNGNASTSMGAIEGLAKEVMDGSAAIASGLHDIADAIRSRS